MDFKRKLAARPGLGLALLAMTLIAMIALLIAMPAFARGGDYGVATGASSNCGGTSQPACTMNWNGYGLTYSHTDADGDLVYTFDDFDCTVYGHPNGTWSGRGSECDQYQPPASP